MVVSDLLFYSAMQTVHSFRRRHGIGAPEVRTLRSKPSRCWQLARLS